MYPVSRKAQRNRFAHFRAQGLFAPTEDAAVRAGHPDILTTPAAAYRSRIREGLLGFKPVNAPALL